MENIIYIALSKKIVLPKLVPHGNFTHALGITIFAYKINLFIENAFKLGITHNLFFQKSI